MPFRYFEDFSLDDVFEYGSRAVSEAELIAFGKIYDPQPMHTDPEAAKATFIGGLIASGWHTICLQMRVLIDELLNDSACLGAPGVTSLRWLQPVRPGDTLSSRLRFTAMKASKTRPEIGFLTSVLEGRNQKGEIVIEQINPLMIGRRPQGGHRDPLQRDPAFLAFQAAAPKGYYGETGLRPLKLLLPPDDPDMRLDPFEDLALGTREILGSFVFSAEEIIDFATYFDPQPFHLIDELARRSHFGRLAASGWQTGLIWMRLMIEHRNAGARAMLARGEMPAELGPSPGFKDLSWLKPVFAGDTLTYVSTLVDKRVSASRPGWGLVTHHNHAENQNGERVFEFTGTVFWQRRL